MRLSSKRELARQLGVSETAVRRAGQAGRIRREPDGVGDLAKVRGAWSGKTDAAQQQHRARTVKPVPEAAVAAVQETVLDLLATSDALKDQ